MGSEYNDTVTSEGGTAELENPLTDVWVPQREDAAIAHLRPESSFLDFFRQSLTFTGSYCTDPRCCDFHEKPNFSNRIEEGNGGQGETTNGQSNMDLAYPLVLFERLEGLPPMHLIRGLADEFRSQRLPSIPFLSSIECLRVPLTELPSYLLLPLALLGAAASPKHEIRPTKDVLWRAGDALIWGTCEVDNTLPRSTTWHLAATLLVLYGVTQTRGAVWSQTDVMSGLIHATVYHPGWLTKQKHTSPAQVATEGTVEPDVLKFRAFYFLLDTLRAIHFQTPSMIEMAYNIPIGPQGEYDLRIFTESLTMIGEPLPGNLSSDDLLLVLCNIISDTNRVYCSIGPLTQAGSSIRRRLESLFSAPTANTTSSTQSMTGTSGSFEILKAESSLYVPSTADSEFDRLRTKLSSFLTRWRMCLESLNSRVSGDSAVAGAGIWPLFHFARLLLSAGQLLYTLPSLAGYVPREYDSIPPSLPRPCSPHDVGIDLGDAELQMAIDILESVEEDAALRGSMGGTSIAHQCCPMWYPWALFYGALVVWARMTADAAAKDITRPRHGVFTTRKLLQMFQAELTRTGQDWSCATQMAAVVDTLITNTV